MAQYLFKDFLYVGLTQLLQLNWHEIVGVTTNSITPATTNTVDIGSSSLKYKDLHSAGNALVGGTLGVTGNTTLSSLNSTTSSLGSVTVAQADVTTVLLTVSLLAATLLPRSLVQRFCKQVVLLAILLAMLQEM